MLGKRTSNRYLILSHKIKRVLAVHVMESGAGRKSDVVVAVPRIEGLLEVLAVHVADVGPVIDPAPPGVTKIKAGNYCQMREILLHMKRQDSRYLFIHVFVTNLLTTRQVF